MIRIAVLQIPALAQYCGYRILRIPRYCAYTELHIHTKNQYCICIHGYVRIHASPGREHDDHQLQVAVVMVVVMGNEMHNSGGQTVM